MSSEESERLHAERARQWYTCLYCGVHDDRHEEGVRHYRCRGEGRHGHGAGRECWRTFGGVVRKGREALLRCVEELDDAERAFLLLRRGME